MSKRVWDVVFDLVGAFFVVSAGVWLFTGLGLWAPDESAGKGREFLLFVAHMLGILQVAFRRIAAAL